MNNKNITIELSPDYAIVFYEYIYRLNKNREKNLVENKAEQRVLRDIECILESNIPSIIDKDYSNILAKAIVNIGE